MENQAVKKALESNVGQALKEYLAKEYAKFKDIESVEEKSTLRLQSVQDEAHRLTCKWIREILDEWMDMSEEPKSKDPRDDYGVAVE